MTKKRSKKQPRTGSSTPILIGVDLGGTNVRAGLVRNSRVGRVSSQPIRGHGRADDVFEDLCAVIDQVFTEDVEGIGVGAPSLVDRKAGTIISTTNIPSWENIPLRKKLEKRYGVPVRLDNDANCFALGEHAFGYGRGTENFVGLITGTGLGAGIVSRGRLHSGVDCAAGEFGLIPYRDSIIEHYASGQFFSRMGLDGAAFHEKAKAGDARALKLFDDYGQHLGFAIQIVLYALAPEMIVLGGSVSKAFPFYAASLERSLANFAYPSVIRKLKIKISKIQHVAVLGAAGLVTDDLKT